MYDSQKTAERIKAQAKSKGILIKAMLHDCDLSKNTLSTMLSRGSWPQTNNLARIADYLDCSVDYLLGRVDEPDLSLPINSDTPAIERITKKLPKLNDVQLESVEKRVDVYIEDNTGRSSEAFVPLQVAARSGIEITPRIPDHPIDLPADDELIP